MHSSATGSSNASKRRIMTPSEFYTGIVTGQKGLTSGFAQGYAQALYDAGRIEMDGLSQYVGAAASGELRRNLAHPCGELVDALDMAAFEVAAESVAVSDMLSALAEALKHDDLAAFEREWVGRRRVEAPASNDGLDVDAADVDDGAADRTPAGAKEASSGWNPDESLSELVASKSNKQ